MSMPADASGDFARMLTALRGPDGVIEVPAGLFDEPIRVGPPAFSDPDSWWSLAFDQLEATAA